MTPITEYTLCTRDKGLPDEVSFPVTYEERAGRDYVCRGLQNRDDIDRVITELTFHLSPQENQAAMRLSGHYVLKSEQQTILRRGALQGQFDNDRWILRPQGVQRPTTWTLIKPPNPQT